MPTSIPYKSFCWGLGTTSFRTKNFNKTIEEQLSLLDEFWSLAEYQTETWIGNNALQAKYYDFIKSKGFVVGDANNKPKDAREKTSGLVDIGLIDEGRKLTEAGTALLEISRSGDFSTDNVLMIPKDSFIFLKQLLKTQNNVSGKCVRPFIVLLYVLSQLEYLTLEEFTYLLPLCTDSESAEYIIQKIKEVRSHAETVNSIIIDRLMSMDNYQQGLDLLINSTVSEEIICTVGFNRKSRSFDKSYYPLYQELYKVFVRNETSSIENVYQATRNVNVGKYWREYLFDTTSARAISNDPTEHLNHTIFSGVTDDVEFKTAFYKIMHLFKAKATLSDYLDLNRRYIKTTDIILFEDGVVKADIVPKYLFNSVIGELYKKAYEGSALLFSNCNLEEIDRSLIVDETAIIDGINEELGTSITTMAEAFIVTEENRYRRLQRLIDTAFTDEKLLELLDMFAARDDARINAMVTDNADIPTIFEYVLGILWYKASERQGKILDYMKLSLDADLLPKTHAAGGEADIVYEYSETPHYPEHTLLLEATLADRTNQRRMEMEPVSRHLGQHLIRTGNMYSYCVFATNFLNINVIADFRSRKTTPYYDPNDYENHVDGMKIIPLEIKELKSIVSKGIKYKELYRFFDEAYNSDLVPHEWYSNCVETI